MRVRLAVGRRSRSAQAGSRGRGEAQAVLQAPGAASRAVWGLWAGAAGRAGVW